MKNSYPLDYGYVHNVREQPERFVEAKEAIEVWCVGEGWHLGAVFADVGSLLDLDDRIGLRGLVQALAVPKASAVVLNRTTARVDWMWWRPFVNQVRRTGAAL